MNVIVTILLFIVLLGVIICIHEWGHLMAAKLFGVYCFEYSFGMGPALYQKHTKETVYSIRAIPVGGYVSMAGEEDGDAAYPDVHVPEGRRLTDKKPWQKIIIMLAGVFMNFVLCWVIFSMVMLSYGTIAESPAAVIDKVMENSAAEKAGLEAGDKILRVTTSDGISTKPETYQDLQYFLAQTTDEPVTMEIKSGEETLTVTVTPTYNEEYQQYMIGIQGPSAEVVKINLLNCWGYGASEMGAVTKAMLTSIQRVFRPGGASQLSGPVGIYSATSQAVSYGIGSYMLLIAELSLSVGIFNLLPLPVLDGGQVVITIVEWITGRPVNEKVKYAIILICWALLIALMLYVTWNDISRLAG